MEAGLEDDQSEQKIPGLPLICPLALGTSRLMGNSMTGRTLGLGILAAVLAAAALTLWLAAPLRMLGPQLFGLTCSKNVCVETPGDLEPALAIFTEAKADVIELAGLQVPDLKIVMCRTAECYRRFGGGEERAMSYPYLGMIVAGHSWQDYIIRHELAHWLQFEHFGAVETMRLPVWFREGMAYDLSGAPDWDIPQPFKSWMGQYRDWQGSRSAGEVFSARPDID